MKRFLKSIASNKNAIKQKIYTKPSEFYSGIKNRKYGQQSLMYEHRGKDGNSGYHRIFNHGAGSSRVGAQTPIPGVRTDLQGWSSPRPGAQTSLQGWSSEIPGAEKRIAQHERGQTAISKPEDRTVEGNNRGRFGKGALVAAGVGTSGLIGTGVGVGIGQNIESNRETY